MVFGIGVIWEEVVPHKYMRQKNIDVVLEISIHVEK